MKKPERVFHYRNCWEIYSMIDSYTKILRGIIFALQIWKNKIQFPLKLFFPQHNIFHSLIPGKFYSLKL